MSESNQEKKRVQNVQNRIKGNGVEVIPVSPKSVETEPGKVITVNVQVKNNNDREEPLFHSVNIPSDRQIITPPNPFRLEAFDTQGSVIGVAEDDYKGRQLEISGSGVLDEQGEKKVDFLIRAPENQKKNLFGMRDEFLLNYADSALMISLGDKNYSLSPLSGFISYGRGAELSIGPGSLESGAYYFKTGWDDPSVKEAGAYISNRFREIVNLRGNFLKKVSETDDFDGDFHDSIYTIQARARPNEMLDLGVEYGACRSRREKKSVDHAYRFDLKGNLSDQVWYAFENTYAGPEFFGYYSDTDHSAGTLTFPIYQNLRGTISYRRTEDNIERNPSKSRANLQTSYQGGISYTTSFKTSLSLDYEDFHRQDRLFPAKYDFIDNLLKLGISQDFNRFSIRTIIETGKRNNRLDHYENKSIERYGLYASLFPSENQAYSLYVRSGHEQYAVDPDSNTSAGASFSWKFYDRIAVSAGFEKKNIDSRKRKEQDCFSSSVFYKLPNSHFVNLKGGYEDIKGGGGDHASVLVSYNIPFSVPMSKK